MVIAPTISAMTAVGGMPSVNSGMNEVCAAALFADSGPATPSTAPLPNSLGRLDTFFSRPYAANDASSAPPPGRMPSSEPMVVPRMTAGIERRISSRFGISEVSFCCRMSRFSFFVRLIRISAKPKTPTAICAVPMPSVSSGTPNEKRAMPEFTSVPTMPNNRPSTIIAIALRSEPCASTTAPIMPSTISEKYSAGPNLSASSVIGSAKAASSNVPTQPAKNEPSAAIHSAAPARPLRAIW